MIGDMTMPAGHDHHSDQWDKQLASLERDGCVSSPWVSQAVQWLIDDMAGPPIEHVVDVGAGPGFAACAFAEALPSARVTALDPTASFLERTRERARERGVADRLSTHEGDIDSSLSALASADLVWSSHVVHHTADPVDALRKLGSLLTADGRLAIAEGGLPMRVLPGDYGLGAPGFPARLDATLDEYAVREWGLPEAATGGAKDWPVMFGDAGLVPVQSRTFLLDRPAPLHDTVRAYVVAQFAKAREQVGDRLDRADARALDRLLDASDQVSLIRRPDLFVLSASTVHIAARGSATTAAER